MSGTITTTPVVLVVSPSLNIDGRKAYSTRGQLFDGKVDGRCFVERSTTPFCDGARVLLVGGVDPATKLVMRHANSPNDALRSTVGVAAALTVADDNGGKPIFRKWSPYDREETIPVASPRRAPGSAAVPSTRGTGTRSRGRSMTGSSLLAWHAIA